MSLTSVDKKLSPRQQAEAEVAKERDRDNVKRFKELLERKAKAEDIVKNIERELADLEIELG